ncbi:hypothetical protein [Sphingomonas sp. CFBP9019]|uniref:hypothetical protein n=1 Tax=Sphingomonas sp. CFBP9019 TaxID=3096532 RepID=UPI002A6ABA99|nr:hypothetical protein [Sphingomonas sp. CFBP9019]MDY1009906.1 hypothetical protein [Sphingomonas sp. CFBP9019]
MADLSSGLIGLGLLTGTSMADVASSAVTIETRAQRRARLQFTTPATTPPWKISATPPPVRSQVAAITALRSIIDRAAPGGSGPLPADVQTSFISYKALDRLRILAETAAGTTTGSRDRAALQKTFDRGLADLQTYLGSAPSDLVDLSFGSIARQVQSVAVAAPASLSATTIAGKGIVAARDAVLPGVAGTETLRIGLSTTTSADSILVALDGATTLDGIADRINAAIAAVPRRDAAGAVELDAQGAPVPRWEVRIEPAKTGDRWGLSITRGGFETVAIDQVGAGDALMIARGVATPVTARPPVAPATAAPAPVVSVAIGRIDDPAGTMTRRSFATIAAVDTAATERLKIAADADKTGKTKATTIAASVGTAAMATDAQGFSYIVGTSAGDLGANRADGADDLLLTKVDSEGAVVWTRMLGTTGSARGAAVTIGPDGGIVVAGTVAGGFDGGTSDGDMLVAKYDAQGDERFATLVRATGPQQAAAVAVASDGTIYVGGQNGAADGEAVITRIDATGRVGERRVIDDAGSVRGLAVAADGALLALTAEAGRAVLRRIDGAALSSDLARLDLGRGDARALAVAADGGIAVVGAADAALDGVQVNARTGGRDAFVARVDPALQTAAITYLGTSAEDQADSVAWLGGAIHVGGRTAGVLDTARTGDVDAFVARIDAATGAIAAVRQFGTAGTRADAVQVSAAPGGNSVLGALGLHRGTLTPTDSVTLEAQTALRAGDSFAIRVNGGPPTAILLTDTDTLTTLADRVRRLVGRRVGSVTTPTAKDGRSLRVDLKPGNAVEFVAGPVGRDALAKLGLPARRITAPAAADPAAPRIRPGGSFGLDLTATLRIDTRADAAAALARIKQAISFTQSAYRSLYWDDTKALLANDTPKSGRKPGSTAIEQKQTANYQAALSRLSSPSTSYGF